MEMTSFGSDAFDLHLRSRAAALLQNIVTDFRWRIGADLMQGYLSVASCEIDTLSDDSCDAFEQPVLQDEITGKKVGQELGSLAPNKEGIKKEMFNIIVKFRDNRRNRIRKLAQMKSEFYTKIIQRQLNCLTRSTLGCTANDIVFGPRAN
jgi:hypothetical protein